MKFITFLLFLAGCASVITDGYVPDKGCLAPIPRENLSNDRWALGLSPRVHTYEMNHEQKVKVHTAIELVRRAIATREFKIAVINYEYKGKKQFASTSLSNKSVYDLIVRGSEDFSIGNDNEMDLELTTFTENSDTIAYTRWGLPMIYFNTKYFNHNHLRMANTVMHEWLHKLGFHHPEGAGPDRVNSVPYAVGYIVEDVAANYYNYGCYSAN